MQVDKQYITNSAQETQQIGQTLAEDLLRSDSRIGATIITLSGDLGAGKTTFTQGFARGLGITEKVLSPTFVVMKKFQIPDSQYKTLYHIDCYRVETETDMDSLNLPQTFANPENIVLIEWPERIEKTLPRDILRIRFGHGSPDMREIVIE